MDQARLRRLLWACPGIRPLVFQDRHEAGYQQPDSAVTVQPVNAGDTTPRRQAVGPGQADASLESFRLTAIRQMLSGYYWSQAHTITRRQQLGLRHRASYSPGAGAHLPVTGSAR
jgi:hypothetical protein